jgi:regulator of protease activity HflC (stomatin/prohibitin superfamily)
MMRGIGLLSLAVIGGFGGCGYVVEPGHRGLLFNPRRGGLQQEVLAEGWHRVGVYGRVDDFDVTYSTKHEDLRTISAEGLSMSVRVSIIFRPVVSELYDLDVEIGRNYYDEVVGPEFRTATRGVFARHSYLEVQRINEQLEDEIEAEVRRRISGKHVEISSVTMEAFDYAPAISAAMTARLVGEQEAIRRKAQLESDALRQNQELQHAAEREKMQTEAELRKKERDRQIAEQQAAIDRVQAEAEAATRVTRAKAEAAAISLLTEAQAKQKRAEAQALTPLVVQMHAYDALSHLGGDGTTIMLGDWSRVPSFLFPGMSGWRPTTAARASAP